MVKSEGSREPGRTASKEELNAFADDGVSEVCENEQVFATWAGGHRREESRPSAQDCGSRFFRSFEASVEW